jgi:DNA polymerase I-like protein with 3'-5' exonuclease and polymerase domains
MKLEILATIFELFFPGKQYEVSIDNYETLLTAVVDNKKYSVEYDQEENHLQVWTIDLNERFAINYIIEGSPEDIIKLSKILQS